MSPIPWHLLPQHCDVGPRGLTLHGHAIEDLVKTYGTPLFIYDEDELKARCREAVSVFGPGVSYASKAFLCLAMARLASEAGMHLDVASGGELHVALSAGVPASTLVLHGNNKSRSELAMALEQGVGRIVVDSDDELDRIEALVKGGAPSPKIWLRITPGVQAHTHEFVQTGQEDSKFGFGYKSGSAAKAIARARGSHHLQLCGLHFHIGSQIFATGSFERAVDVIAPIFKPLGLPELCIGGGLGVAYVEGESAPSITEWGQTLLAACKRAGLDATISAEPGRAIVAKAAMTVYEVGTIKDIPKIRTYVAVDGGMSDNPRPVLYGSGYETFLVRSPKANRTKTVTVVGKHCESGDVLVRNGRVPEDLSVGDLLGTPVTGAYGHSMGSNYNQVPRPPVVFVSAEGHRAVVRRETYDDLLRGQS